MTEISEQGLYPAEHRSLRELYAGARALAAHWDRLARRLGEPEAAALQAGAADARTLLTELAGVTAAYDLHGYPAAQGAGFNLARLRNEAADLLLERHQAMRTAVLDVQHLVTLLGYLGALAERREDVPLTAFLRRWERLMRSHEDAARAAAIAQAGDPDRAIEPADPTVAGKAGHALANAFGTIGEAVDASIIGRIARGARHQRD